MKSKSILLLFCCHIIATVASGQLGVLVLRGAAAARKSHIRHKNGNIDNLSFRIDTLHYYDSNILMQRYEDKDLMSVLGDNSNENRVALEIVKLQKQLNSMNDYVIQKREINFLQVVEGHIDYISKQNTGFDVTFYEKEYKFYCNYNKDLIRSRNEKYAQEAKSRKIELAKNKADLAEKTRIEDSTIAVKRIERERELHLEDSIATVYEKEEERKRKKKIISKYGKELGSLIFAGKVRIGMTKEMCIASWGEPYDINKTITSGAIREQWVYSLKSYLYFENGTLTTIQN